MNDLKEGDMIVREVVKIKVIRGSGKGGNSSQKNNWQEQVMEPLRNGSTLMFQGKAPTAYNVSMTESEAVTHLIMGDAVGEQKIAVGSPAWVKGVLPERSANAQIQVTIQNIVTDSSTVKELAQKLMDDSN